MKEDGFKFNSPLEVFVSGAKSPMYRVETCRFFANASLRTYPCENMIEKFGFPSKPLLENWPGRPLAGPFSRRPVFSPATRLAGCRSVRPSPVAWLDWFLDKAEVLRRDLARDAIEQPRRKYLQAEGRGNGGRRDARGNKGARRIKCLCSRSFG